MVNENKELMALLQKEIPILTAQIRALYEELDKKYHLAYGKGNIEHIQQTQDAVRLHIRFKEELKIIDQGWLLRTRYKKIT